jgi:peptidoglycan/xylan/chitin deacetylase (PgdA/CDA1 family)
MTEADFGTAYQWQYRPRLPERPGWFTSWPEGARLAMSVTILHEWESMPRPVRPMPANSHHQLDFLALGAREYGVRDGLPRLLDTVERHGLHATVLCNGLVAQLFPESVREAHRRGHEIACHQWDQAIHPPVYSSKEQEAEALDRAITAIEAVTQEKVLGYMSQGPRPTEHTLDLIAERGFRWTGDYVDSDICQVLDVDGHKMASVGYAWPASVDFDIAPLGAAGALQQLTADFDAIYAESANHPMKIRYAIHTHIGGRPAMAQALDQWLTHIRAHEDVWFCRSIDMANFWLEQTQTHQSAEARQ